MRTTHQATREGTSNSAVHVHEGLLGIHGDDIDSAIDTYNMMSNKYAIHANLPFNVRDQPRTDVQLLPDTPEDSIDGSHYP
jgi:hypothetical protein